MSEPNVAELVAIYQHIKDNPDEWNQRMWGRRTKCGTAFCFAGHAAVRAGAKPLWQLGFGGPELFDFVMTPDGKREDVENFAVQVLGIDPAYAFAEDGGEGLFEAYNTLADIRRIITRITGVDPDPGEPS